MGEGPRERGHGQEGGEPQSQGSRVAGGRGKGRWFQFSCPRPGFLSTSMWKSPRSYHQSITSNSAKVQGLGGWENQGDLGLGGLNSAPWPSPSFQLEAMLRTAALLRFLPTGCAPWGSTEQVGPLCCEHFPRKRHWQAWLKQNNAVRSPDVSGRQSVTQQRPRRKSLWHLGSGWDSPY